MQEEEDQDEIPTDYTVTGELGSGSAIATCDHCGREYCESPDDEDKDYLTKVIKQPCASDDCPSRWEARGIPYPALGLIPNY